MVHYISGLDNDEDDVDSHEEKDDWEGKGDLQRTLSNILKASINDSELISSECCLLIIWRESFFFWTIKNTMNAKWSIEEIENALKSDMPLCCIVNI